MNNIFVFIEGGKGYSQHQFWNEVNKVIYNNRLSIIPCGGIKNVENTFLQFWLNKKIDNQDIILFDLDYVTDNKVVVNTVKAIKDKIKGKKAWDWEVYGVRKSALSRISNAHILDSVCFEDTILQASGIFNWVHSITERKTNSKVKYLQDVLKHYLLSRTTGWKADSELCEFMRKERLSINDSSLEVLAARLLLRITQSRKSELTIDKSSIGNCYKIDCKCKNCKCEIIRRGRGRLPKEYTCGIYFVSTKAKPITNKLKIAYLYKNSDLNRQISIAKRSLSSYPIASNLVVLP